MNTREDLLAWMDQYENDHYVYDLYGEEVVVDLPRPIVEEVLDIAILLVDRVVAAKGELTSAEYEKLEEKVRKQNPNDSSWLSHVVEEALADEHLFGRYKDIEPMIGNLMPRGYPPNSMAYFFLFRPDIHKLIYAVIRHVDDVQENYDELVYTFFVGVLAKGWGEGFGWSKNEKGNWVWHNKKYGSGNDTKTGE